MMLSLWLAAMVVAQTATTTVPLMMTTKFNHPSEAEAAATLNQDGTWTIWGNLGMLMGFDPGYDCLADELRKANPASNPNPDNSRPMSQAQMEFVMCQSPIVRACLPKLRPHFTCEPQIVQEMPR